MEKNKIVLCANLTDKFAVHGIVSYMAFELTDSTINITDWIMSCRVFSRTLEHKMMMKLIDYATVSKASVIKLSYVPTAKNSLMIDVFTKMGFIKQRSEENSWLLSSNKFCSIDSVIL